MLLAWFARVKPGENVLDLGTGCRRCSAAYEGEDGRETFYRARDPGEERSYGQAERGLESSGTGCFYCDGRYEKEAAGLFGAASFDVVTSNPPYMTGSHGLINPHQPKAIARHEILCTLEDVISQAAETSDQQWKILHGTPAVPPGGDHGNYDEVSSGAETDAAGASLYRPGAEHGSDRSASRRKAEDNGKTADRL